MKRDDDKETMQPLPLADPGTPDVRSPRRFLLWLALRQSRTVAAAAALGVIWMLAQAAVPLLVGRIIDRMFTAPSSGSGPGLAGAAADCLPLAGLAVLLHGSGALRNRCSESSARTANSRAVQLVCRRAVVPGGFGGSRTAGGLAAVSGADIAPLGDFLRIAARAAGALVTFGAVAAFLLATAPALGWTALVGMPLLVLGIHPLLRPLLGGQHALRRVLDDLSTMAVDAVHGQRVLRGAGGAEEFARRYRARSQEARAASVRLARTETLVDGVQVLLPGLFGLLAVGWSAHLALSGAISPGTLVSLAGLVAFLVVPLQTAAEFYDKAAKAEVAAGRVLAVLTAPPQAPAPPAPLPLPPPGAGPELGDAPADLAFPAGRLTVVQAPDATTGAELADRLAGYGGPGASFRGVPLQALDRREVRQRVLVATPLSGVFAGTLREVVDPRGEHSEEDVGRALHAASAEDVARALPAGLASPVGGRGHTLSGGQRQRLIVARALLADPEVLVLFAPTQAVDASTEARMARRIAGFRTGRTTVVITDSPAFTAHADVRADLAGRPADGEADR
ncbi:ABC transporter ATP-binding protein [Streptomyces sp. CA2R106]|uniref:ABC transporter ATP-binding protein n=1 Tax=Streptomyces sp. CA2R106 TaxID=3120153 RepID=UPI00300BB5AE